MGEEDQRWWKNPQGILSMATIFTLVVGFFWVREKQMWENSSRITAIEQRGDKAIISVGTRLERIETVLSEGRDRLNSLERQIDRLETKQAEFEKFEDKAQKQYRPYE